MSSTFLQIATIEHEQKGKKLYIDKEKDGTYIPMEVQDNSAAYEGFITPKSQKNFLEGAALKLPPGLSAPDPAQQISVFYDFLENIFIMNVAPKTLKVKLHWLF